MKIWIVASDPFLKDFEKIANKWPREHVVLISAVSKFGFGIKGHLDFYKEYKKFGPDIILTDHGHTGFSLINFINKLKGKKINLYVFLRGNYWLEKRLRGD